MTEIRTPNHLAVAYGGEVVHAASDTQRQHTIACTGRTMGALAWSGTVDEVTCAGCLKALASGRAKWVGKTL